MNDVIQKIYDIGIVPVIAIDDADKAVPLAKALVKGGLPAAEVTFRTAAAEEAIKRIVAEVPEMLVGAGTVLTKEQADRAIAAGVKFIVSPGFNPEITKYVIDKGMLMMPGTATPGEMEQAMSMGLDVVKFFPAEQNGGQRHHAHGWRRAFRRFGFRREVGTDEAGRRIAGREDGMVQHRDEKALVVGKSEQQRIVETGD